MSKKTPFFTFPYVTTPPQPRGTAALPWGGAHDDVQHCSDHNKLTVPKMELFALNSSVHEILHRAHQLVRYNFTTGLMTGSMILLKAAALCAPSHPVLPSTLALEVM